MRKRQPKEDVVAPLRARLKELLTAHHWSYARLCAKLTEDTGQPWKEQRFGKVMNGKIRLRLEDLIHISRAAGISLVEIVREPGREFYADLTPSELRVLQLAREHETLLPTLLHVARLAEQSKPVSYRAQLRARQATIKARMETPED